MSALKQGMLSKRAQGKSSMGRMNWKERFFVLSPGELTYWDKFGGKSAGANCRGQIDLNAVKGVEIVSEEAFGKNHMMQIMYDAHVLYTQAADNSDRDEWMRVLREQIAKNSHLQGTFHPKHYDGKWWSCCKAGKATEGCIACYDYTSIASGGAAPAASSISSAQDRPLPTIPPQSQPEPAPVASPAAAAASPALPPPNPQSPPAVSNGGASNHSLLSSDFCSSPTAADFNPEDIVKPQINFEVVSQYEYAAVDDHDLSMGKGEHLIVLEMSEEHWWKAKNMSGKEGFIPSNYVRRCGLEAEPWFHGKMSRSEAASLIRVAKQEGTFLVRESETKLGQYSLSVSHGDSLRHYHVKHVDGEYYINERHRFPTVSKLIEYHKLNSGGLVTRLRKAISEVNAPVSAGLGHGKWEIDHSEITFSRELGSGQFGVVKEGTYKNGMRVAVKMMKKDSMSEDDFIAEAQVMKNFSHPNLVQLYGVCTSVRPIYIVTELMVEGCLLDYLRNNSWMPKRPEIIHYMSIQVAAAMVFLESHKFIHRDLAARNCLVGEQYVVKVADFGLARFVLDDEYTASEGTKFPIKWAAPEVISFARFSTKSDVWSYGILLWELWTVGKTPYPSFTNAEVVDKVTDGYRLGRPPLASHQLHQLMLDCWHHDPESRPSYVEVEKRLEENKGDYHDMDE